MPLQLRCSTADHWTFTHQSVGSPLQEPISELSEHSLFYWVYSYKAVEIWPLYNPPKPSDRIICTKAGYDLYIYINDAVEDIVEKRNVPFSRSFELNPRFYHINFSNDQFLIVRRKSECEQGVFRVVPTNPPTVPATRLLPSSARFVFHTQLMRDMKDAYRRLW